MYLFKLVFLLSLGKGPAVELLDHNVSVTLFFNFLSTCQTFSEDQCHFAFPPVVETGFQSLHFIINPHSFPVSGLKPS